MKKLVVLSKDLMNYNGHYYEYIKSLKETFEPRSVAVRIYGHQDIDPLIGEELDAVPYFYDHQPSSWLTRVPFLGKVYKRIQSRIEHIRQLRHVYEKEQGEETYFMFEFVIWTIILPIVFSFRKQKPKAILIFRLSINDDVGSYKKMKALARAIYRYSFRFLMKHKYVLASDSEVIAREFKDTYKGDMAVLPIPHLNDSPEPVLLSQKDPAAKFVCYVPGMFAKHKGVDFILNTFEALSATADELNDKIVLVTQYNDRLFDKENNERIRGRLQNTKIGNTFLSSLSSAEYNEQFSRCDIVLVVYDLESGFGHRTSGVMSDAIAFEKPFITSKGTWMDIQAGKYGTGVSVAYSDVQGLIEALRTVISNYTIYQERARAAKPAWLSFHSKENYYRVLMQAIADQKQVSAQTA